MRRFALRLLACLVVAAVFAVATGEPPQPLAQEAGRVFPEPADSTDFITRGPDDAPEQFKEGMLELQRRYPRYLTFSTIRQRMREPLAVSVGEDGVPAWHPEDTGDGEDFYVVTVTDKKSPVPRHKKGFVLFTVAHAAEWCGRESIPRFFEDLVTLATTAPNTILDGATGLDGTPLKITVRQALRRTNLMFVDVSPDGWVRGERDAYGPSRQYGQANGAGVNSNRVAYQDGWVFPDDKVIRGNGYSTMTQPEGIVTTEYLRRVRKYQLKGRPFATSIDWHGPLPVGAQLFHDQGNDPAKLGRVRDLAERMSQRAYGVLGQYATEYGADAHQQFAGNADTARMAAFSAYQQLFGGVDEKAAYLTLHWNDYATAWDHLDYTVSSTFGGWAASDAGLDADGFSHEQPCQVLDNVWKPHPVQLYVDNIRAMSEAMVVHAAFRNQRPVVEKHHLRGSVGFVDTGTRVTNADGNPSPPPKGVRSPITGRLRQVPYNVANTDYFRDLRAVTPKPIHKLTPTDVRGGRFGVDSVVVADHRRADGTRLKRFATRGGNVVLTDRALKLLPSILGIDSTAVRGHHAYVGYADLDHEHPWANGLSSRARQMFDPVGLGYPLLMERDQYWPCSPECEESITRNSAPLWTVARDVWEAKGGQTIATADPPQDRKGEYEGTATDKTIIGTLRLGKGRLVVLGGVLPQPTERYPHWFGLNAYTVSVTGQQMLVNALTWKRPQ